jgi:ABC-type Fe3+/spermidine/putrescine transport system ATPase subunit
MASIVGASTSPEPPKLQVVAVEKWFGDMAAVAGVSLVVARGEIVALVGPSGSGKTTLLKMIGGHEHPDEGEILIDGRPITHLPANRIPTATVFQNYALFPHFDVYQNVAFGLRMRGIDERHVRDRVGAVLALVGLTGFEQRDVTTLSGGEKQRVATARSLAVEPEILLMDEPLGALDRLIRLRMQRELGELLRRVGVTTVYVTHNQHEALTMADRVAVMERGRLRQIGSPLEIYRHPRSRFVATFMGDANFIDGVVAEVAEGCAWLTIGAMRLPGRLLSGQLITPGLPASAMLRPEDVRIAPEPEPGRDWRARVVAATYSGELTEYVAEVEALARTLRIKALGMPVAAVGETVAVSWDGGNVVILPERETEPARVGSEDGGPDRH